jgi:hypothetical protein
LSLMCACPQPVLTNLIDRRVSVSEDNMAHDKLVVFCSCTMWI